MNLRFSEDSSILCSVARADGVRGSAALACVWAAAARRDGVWAALSLLGQRRVDVFTSALVLRRVDKDAAQPPAALGSAFRAG